MSCKLQERRIGELVAKLDATGNEWVLYRSHCAPELGVVIEVGKPVVACRVDGPKIPFFSHGKDLVAVEGALEQAVAHIESEREFPRVSA